jgi:hypothetical protein
MFPAGPLTLLKVVLSDLPIFIMTAHPLLAWAIVQVDKIHTIWLWDGSAECSPSQCKVAWAKICRPWSLLVCACLTYTNSVTPPDCCGYPSLGGPRANLPLVGLEGPAATVDQDLFASTTTVTLGEGARRASGRTLGLTSPFASAGLCSSPPLGGRTATRTTLCTMTSGPISSLCLPDFFLLRRLFVTRPPRPTLTMSFTGSHLLACTRPSVAIACNSATPALRPSSSFGLLRRHPSACFLPLAHVAAEDRHR